MPFHRALESPVAFPPAFPTKMGQRHVMKPRSRRWRTWFAFALVSIGLLVLTAWNLTRSTALAAARGAYSRGNLALCLEHALNHLRRQPWSREAALYAARSLSRLDYADLAEPYFRRAGQLEQNDQQLQAYGLVRGPNPERAIPVFHEILAREPDNVTALRRLAAVELAQHNTAELLKLADRLCRVPKGAVIGQTLLGVVYHNDDNPQRAVACLERVLREDPELREMPLPRRLFWSHLSDDLVRSGRIDDASALLINAVASTPDADLMNRLGQIYFLQGKFETRRAVLPASDRVGTRKFRPSLEPLGNRSSASSMGGGSGPSEPGQPARAL